MGARARKHLSGIAAAADWCRESLTGRPAAAPAAESTRLVPQPHTWDMGAARILYVEDDLSNLELVESILCGCTSAERP
jgi:hypothetical protein